jgi:hypothetical protein
MYPLDILELAAGESPVRMPLAIFKAFSSALEAHRELNAWIIPSGNGNMFCSAPLHFDIPFGYLT